ncbi:MAG: amino acid racemase [Snowella sp.]|nr:amino acid racemase [Snowella sp.]
MAPKNGTKNRYMQLMNSLNQQQAIPGILGGLGTLSHVEFERKLIYEQSQRGAFHDQDYPVWILINAANIPDRSVSILNGTADCVPWLIHYGKLLESAGADFLVVVCNTAHAFYHQVQPHLNIPWLNLIDLTVEFLAQNYPLIKTVGILATDGTISAGLYEKSLQKMGLTVVSNPLNSSLQKQIMQAIYHPQWGIKATGNSISCEVYDTLHWVIAEFKNQAVDLIIPGCTELAIAVSQMEQISIPWLDPLDIMAKITIDTAFYGVTKLTCKD